MAEDAKRRKNGFYHAHDSSEPCKPDCPPLGDDKPAIFGRKGLETIALLAALRGL